MGRPGLSQHRKFRRLARALGSEPLARGVLELLWDACYENGDDYLGTAEDVENLARWTGERNVLALALVSAGLPDGHGFIEPLQHDDGVVRYRVHDLWNHAPDYVRKRRERELARKKKTDPAERRQVDRRAADNDRRTAPGDGICFPSPDSQTESDRTPAPAPAPAPNEGNPSGSCAEPLRDSTPPVLRFPTAGTPPTWDLTQSRVDAWAEAYPGLDILAECRKALAWVEARPARKKTARGMPAFLVNWFSRATDRGGPSTPAMRPTRPEMGPAAWRQACAAAGHDPACATHAQHELRVQVASAGCAHPGVCLSLGACRAKSLKESA